jgi:hypothetical protein
MVEIMALLMFVGAEQKLTEMMYMPSVKKCLEKKRIATRNSNALYICSKVKAELSDDMKIIRIERNQ